MPLKTILNRLQKYPGFVYGVSSRTLFRGRLFELFRRGGVVDGCSTWADPALFHPISRIVSAGAGGVKGRLRRPLRGFALDPASPPPEDAGYGVKAEECEKALERRCNPAKNGTAVTR